MELKRLKLLKNKKGAALMYTMMFLLLLSVIVVSFSLISINMYKTTAYSANKIQNFTLAKAIGQAFALELSEDVDSTSIVAYLENNTQYAKTVKGSASVVFDPKDDSKRSQINQALRGTGLSIDDLAEINLTAGLKFYFKITCANCGAVLEDIKDKTNRDSAYCQSSVCRGLHKEKNINKKYLYLDVTVSYHGVTEVVTTVFTYLDKENFTQTMYDLFSVYNIYSTSPKDMQFDFAAPDDIGGVQPNVYLYNGVDSEEEGYGTTTRETYKLEESIKANLTSTGDVTIKSSSGSIRSILGTVTSYGAMTLDRINIGNASNTSSIYIRNALTVNTTARVYGSIYARNTVSISGPSVSTTMVNGTIYALGNVTIQNCTVGSIVGGAGCNITLKNVKCNNISTDGNVTITNSTVSGNVYCNDLTMKSEGTESKITGKAEVKGNLILESTYSGKNTIGSTSNQDVINVGGNATFKGNGTKVSEILGNVIIAGSINYNNSKSVTKINGSLHVKGNIPVTIGEEIINACYLSALEVTGDVLLSSGNQCVPLFGRLNGSTSEAKTVIGGLLTVYTDMLIGDELGGIIDGEENSTGVSYTFVDGTPKYVNLNGATINKLYIKKKGSTSDLTQALLQNGTIVSGIEAEQIIVSGITIEENCVVMAEGINGAFVAVDNSKLKGKIVANRMFSLHEGSILYATQNGFVHVSGTETEKALAYINGEIEGELVVGKITGSRANGELKIKSKAVLHGNSLNKDIYINGDLIVEAHPLANITNNPEQYAPRLTTENNNGNRIYLSTGTAKLNGWVYDFYVHNAEVIMQDEISGMAGKPYIKGTTFDSSDFVTIGEKGLTNSEGATYTNDNVIVYVYKTPKAPLGDLTISGTLVIKKGERLECNSLKVERIITNDINEELTASNFDSAKARIVNQVNNFNFNSDSEVTGITVNGDTQINQNVSNKITVSGCTFKGWLKLKNVSGKVTINQSQVTGEKYTSYADNDTKSNNSYKGCLDVGSASLHLENSFIGGTASKNNVTQDSSIPYQGNVYTTGVFSMKGGQVYGTVYCSYANNLTSNKISGGLFMSTTSQVSVNWSPTFINKFIYGPKVKAKVTSGTLCGTSPSSTATANNLSTNAYFIRLQDLTMSNSAVVAEYTSVFIDGGTDSKLAGNKIGNVYAKTSKLTIYVADSQSTTKVAGYMYCVGQLQYEDGLTPTAEKGLYASNTTIPISKNNIPFEKIDGNVDIVGNLTFDISFNKVTGYVYAPKAKVTLKSTVDGNVEANTLYVIPNSTTDIKGNVLVNSLYVYTDSYKVHFLENVKTSLLAVNLKLKSTGGDITLTTKIDNPDGQFTPTISSGSYVSFYENVYVSKGTSGSGRAFLKCCTFEKRNSKNSNNGATLYADRGVYASYVKFYGAGYVSTQQHCFTSGLGVYNITSSTYTTNYGSIVAGIAKDETSSYGLYLSDSSCYSNVVLLSSQSSYLNKTTLGEKASADSMTADRKKSYQKYYSFGGDVTMKETHVESITSTNSADPGAYTYVNVAGNLTLQTSSYIGSSYSTERVHAHTGFKGVYVSKKLTINSGCTIRLNIYCKGSLINNGSIQLNIEKKITWSDTKGWGWTNDTLNMESVYTCGGVVYSSSYSGSGSNSLKSSSSGYSMSKNVTNWQSFEKKENQGHNTIEGVINKEVRQKDYTFCTHNSSNCKTSNSGADSCPFSPNRITSMALAGNQVSCGVSRNTSTPTAPSKTILRGFVGVEWSTTEATEVKSKTPLSIIAFSHATTIRNTEVKLVNKTVLPSYRLDTSNRTYWKPQAIPLRWYLPTQTTAGEPVSLNPNANNTMTVAQKKLGASIDALEACQQNFKDFSNLGFWDWVSGEALSIGKSLFNNAKNFFTNLPTLFAPSSSYLGLKFKNDADAKYYRVTATKASSVMSDANGKDLLVITRRCMVVDSTFPSGDLLENLVKYVGWNRDWVIPTSVRFNQRPVGLVFFNSGIVPYSVFDGKNTEYRKYSKESTEKDSAGRWYWGDDGSEGWYGTASPSNDVTWTFFTCEDPTRPYTSKAKDLHIVLPKNAKMVWEKDKDSCLNIIGNGRVFLYLQEGTDIKIVGNGFTNWIHDEYMSGIDNWLKQWMGADATYNVFGGVRYVQTKGYGIDETTYYKNGQVVMDEAAYNSGKFQLQPRMYIVGTGGDINFEVQDFQTAAYVYMPSGYTYGDGSGKNTFKISSNQNAGGYGNWDVYGIYVCDDFEYGNGTGAKVRYYKTAPDLSNTVFKYTKNGYTTTSIGDNRSSYQLAEFWDYPTDLPVSSMDWYYRGIAIS